MNQLSRRSSWTRTVLTVSAVAAMVIVATACTKRTEDQSSKAPAADTGAAATTTVVAAQKMTADSANKLVASLSWDDSDNWDGYLDCEKPSECDNQSKVRIRVVPAPNAHNIDHKKVYDGTETPKLLARVFTLNHAFGPWKLGAHDMAYLGIGGGFDGASPRYALYKYSSSTGFTRLVTAQAGAYCDVSTTHTHPSVHIKYPPECSSKTDIVALYGTPVRIASHESGLWISCSNGCCEASQLQ